MSSTDTAVRERRIRELRTFGLVMAVPLAVIGGLLMWRERVAGPYVLALAAVFTVAALAWPRLLGPIEKVWMGLARVLSVVMTYVILTLTFVLLITPLGLIMRMVGKDPLRLRRDPKRVSWWVPVDPEGPASRPDRPF